MYKFTGRVTSLQRVVTYDAESWSAAGAILHITSVIETTHYLSSLREHWTIRVKATPSHCCSVPMHQLLTHFIYMGEKVSFYQVVQHNTSQIENGMNEVEIRLRWTSQGIFTLHHGNLFLLVWTNLSAFFLPSLKRKPFQIQSLQPAQSIYLLSCMLHRLLSSFAI